MKSGNSVLIKLFQYMDFPLISSFQLKLFIQKEPARSRKGNRDQLSSSYLKSLWLRFRESGRPGTMKKSVVAVRRHFPKVADIPLELHSHVGKA